jgi:hypothetical protein
MNDEVTSIYHRWQALADLSPQDLQKIFDNLPLPIKAATDVLTKAGIEDANQILSNVEITDKEHYLESIGAVIAGSTFFGYVLFLLSKNINPESANFATLMTGDFEKKWTEQFEKNECEDFVQKIEPLFLLILTKSSELFINRLLALYPSSVDLPYKVTERIHQQYNLGTSSGVHPGDDSKFKLISFPPVPVTIQSSYIKKLEPAFSELVPPSAGLAVSAAPPPAALPLFFARVLAGTRTLTGL